MYSQKPLLELLYAGKVPGESGIPKHIETVISNVFLFNERVYKVYKNNNEFFNKSFHDISIKEERFAFSTSDFEWNRQLAKEVHLRLQGVKVEGDSIIFPDESKNAEELLLVTARLPAGTVLLDQLQKGNLTEVDFYEIGKQFAAREKGFVWRGGFPDESLLENMLGRYPDVIEWVKNAETYLSTKEREEYGKWLKELIMRVYTGETASVTICFDFHSLNAFYVNQTLYPFDTHPPKDSWRFGPPWLNIYRLAADIFALAGEKEFRAVIRGYFEQIKVPSPPDEVERLLIVYSALIMVSSLYMLARTDTGKLESALKYHDFLKRYVAS